MNIIVRQLVVALALVISALPVLPDPGVALTAKKASDLVTLRPFFPTPCPFFAFGVVVSRRWMSDATYVDPFVIPEKKVLIVTDVEMSLSGQTPNAMVLVQLLLLDPTNGNSSAIIQRFVPTNSAGQWSETTVLPAGVAVKSGMVLCEPSGALEILVHGYLAADR